MKIIVCTTFRDFKGTDNDNIQLKFLENIKNQTYQDFLLVTTTFGEKNVKKVVDGLLGEKSIVIESNIPKEYKFSLTDVVLNGIRVANDLSDQSIIIWCTCDIIFDSNFFQIIANNYAEGVSGIVHPNAIYTSLSDINNPHKATVEVKKGIDLLFFDSSVLSRAEGDIRNYRFYDWGVFEYFLTSIAMRYAKTRINLFCLTRLKKVVNDRKLTNESKAYFKRCLDMNIPILKKYCSDKNISDKIYRNGWLYDCHCQFKIIKGTPSYYWMKYEYAITRYLKKKLGPLKRKVFGVRAQTES